MNKAKGINRDKYNGKGAPVADIKEQLQATDTPYNRTYVKDLYPNLNLNDLDREEVFKKAIDNKATTFKQRVKNILKNDKKIASHVENTQFYLYI